MESTTCAGCGKPFGCGIREDNCWCASLPPLTTVVEGRGCLCRDCLEKALAPDA